MSLLMSGFFHLKSLKKIPPKLQKHKKDNFIMVLFFFQIMEVKKFPDYIVSLYHGLGSNPGFSDGWGPGFCVGCGPGVEA